MPKLCTSLIENLLGLYRAWAWLVHGSGMRCGWGLAAALASNRIGIELGDEGGAVMELIAVKVDC